MSVWARIADWRIAAFALASAMPPGGPAVPAAIAAPAVSIIEAGDQGELRGRFCAADPRREHILILPAALFVDSEELVCPAGPYRLYRIVEHADPGDFIYFIDPPFGTTGRLACDGKAGRAMTTIAVNCRPE